MKVLLINNRHYTYGGDASVYLNIGNILSDKGHEVVYLSMKHAMNEECISAKYFIKNTDLNKSNIKHQLLNFWKYIYSLDSIKSMKKIINQENPDIIHLHGIRGGITSSVIRIAKKYRIPIIQTIHDYYYLCPTNAKINGHGKICDRCSTGNFFYCTIYKCEQQKYSYSFIHTVESFFNELFIKPIKNLDYIIFVSYFCKNEYNKRFPNISTKSTVLYNVQAKKINIHQNNFQLFFNSYYLYFGRINKLKGLYTLIESFRKFPNLILKIVGDGDDLKKLNVYINKQNIKNIQFVGFKRGEELQEYINNAKYVVVPSEWYENNPMSIIESYGAGKPVIGANIGGIPEILINQKTGFLFESGNVDDLINKIYLSNNVDIKKYNELCNNAYKFAELKFNADAYYEKTINIYRNIIRNYDRK